MWVGVFSLSLSQPTHKDIYATAQRYAFINKAEQVLNYLHIGRKWGVAAESYCLVDSRKGEKGGMATKE